jgi:hypothetical protein
MSLSELLNPITLDNMSNVSKIYADLIESNKYLINKGENNDINIEEKLNNNSDDITFLKNKVIYLENIINNYIIKNNLILNNLLNI